MYVAYGLSQGQEGGDEVVCMSVSLSDIERRELQSAGEEEDADETVQLLRTSDERAEAQKKKYKTSIN